ncbi:unnamed protein product [Oikopleura dioica]|uniref:Tetratricopeptide repeat protein 37 n=1 Tax=Oikopleura dioica TaxID=34765 RepID=E4WTS7_OIKDI|nr:unnamed protein product [Oikopleura dioica]CBY36063.1 unnamed protein product [Oikopleura dioica]
MRLAYPGHASLEQMHVAINEQVVKQNDDAPIKDVVAVEELAKVALLAEKTGSLSRAEATWLELLSRDEANSDNWAGYGRVMYSKGDTGRAYEAFKQAVSLEHSEPWYMILASILAREEGHPNEAKLILQRAAANPEYNDQSTKGGKESRLMERALANIFLSEIHEEQLENRLSEFTKLEGKRLIKLLNSTHPGEGVLLEAAEKLFDSGFTEVSDNLLAKYLSSLDSEEPIPTAALLLRTRLMIKLGKWDVAMETVLLAAESDHKNADVWALKGEIQNLQGDVDDAEESFIRCLSYATPCKDQAFVCLQLGDIFSKQEKFEEARNYYLHACRLSPTAISWLGVGICSLRMNRLLEAEDALAEANLLDSKSPEVWGYLSALCLRTHRKVEAEQSYKYSMKLGLDKSYPVFQEIKTLQAKHGFGDPSLC